jgi:hypothetical protein
MNKLSECHTDRGVGSVFLYTHEAHPGEHWPHHTSMDQKLEHARALRDQLGVTRPILVDALDGPCHRAFGSMPNMAWIVSRSGQALYKSDWTDAKSIETALEYFLEVSARRRNGERMAGFRVERLDFRVRDPQAFLNGLERSGAKAVREFQQTFGGSGT